MTFSSEFAQLLSKELSCCTGDKDRAADLVTEIAKSLGFAVAMVSEGVPEIVEELMAGLTGYAFDIAVAKSEVAQKIASGCYLQ